MTSQEEYLKKNVCTRTAHKMDFYSLDVHDAVLERKKYIKHNKR